MDKSAFKAIFTDVGGVIATNGWDTGIRERMMQNFGLKHEEIYGRHRLMFDSYERGHISLNDYLKWTVFYEPRPFSADQVKQWMFDQGSLLPGTYDLFHQIRNNNPIKLALISNEGEGLTEDRIDRFRLAELADYMLFSAQVRLRKPDPGMWLLALSLGNLTAGEVVYVDDRKMFVDFAASLGFTAYQHTSADDTERYLASVGLRR